MATEKDTAPEVFTYRVRPDGDGRYFVGAKYDSDGQELEVVTQKHMSEPDAEKELRSIVSGADVIASSRLHSVDKDDNKHIVIETTEPIEDRFSGAAVKHVPAAQTGGDYKLPATDGTRTPAQEAVDNGSVAPSDVEEVEPTSAEQKAIDAAAAKAEKEAE